MKFHALTLCLAGTLTTGIAYAQQDASPAPSDRTHDMGTRTQRDRDMRERRATDDDEHYRERQFRMGDSSADYREPGDATYSYAGERIWIRDVLYPDLQPVSQVAAKVSDIDEANLREAAELRAMEGQARTAGWDNAAAVYEHMAQDHVRTADMTRTWLVARDFNPPVEPTVTLAGDMTGQNGVQHLIDEHVTMFNDSLGKLHGETSETVRGLLLVNATTASNHLSLLRELRNDMDLGRHSLSARLQAQMDPTFLASNQSELFARVDRDEEAVFKTNETTVVQVPAAQPQVQVQAAPPPAPAPAPPAQVQVAPAPQPPPQAAVAPQPRRPYRSQVAGRRQSARRRGRRPAY